MAVTVKDLYKKSIARYHMKLIAGESGLNNMVTWIHIIEDSEVGAFLHGRELVLTAGIMSRNDEHWLIDFLGRLKESDISALVVNIGPHISGVSQEAIEFCDENRIPLFTIPWKVRMVDMTRDFSTRIFKSEDAEVNVATLLKNVIFRIGDIESQIGQLERLGYRRNVAMTFLALDLKKNDETCSEEIRQKVQNVIITATREINNRLIQFMYDDIKVLCVTDYQEKDISYVIGKITQICQQLECDIYIGVSQNVSGLEEQSHNFSKMFHALEIARKKKRMVVYYDHLEEYKILLEVKNRSVLEEFYNCILGALVEFDVENDSQLVSFLEEYLA